MKKVLLLGASGNIGQQSLDLFRQDPNYFSLVGFSVGKRIEIIPSLIREFPSVKSIYLIDDKEAERLTKEYPEIHFFSGKSGLSKQIEFSNCDIVENALVGFSGFLPSLTALKQNKILCLANKESLVVGGNIINEILKSGKGKLYPIDSEHVALSKCLTMVKREEVKRLILTASGGAFRNYKREELKNVTAKMALDHPTWKMGTKITIDCATMFNKGFEIIEAMHLFNFNIDDIGVKLHDESYVHSYIELKDGTFIGDVGKPDMHGPIAYALYEGNIPFEVKKASTIEEFGPYHFHDFDEKRYPAVRIAVEAAKKGGNTPAILNAATECADKAFLEGKISFLDIEQSCLYALGEIPFIMNPTPLEIVQTDQKTRDLLERKIS